MELKAGFFMHTDINPVTSGSNEVFIKMILMFICYKQCILVVFLYL